MEQAYRERCKKLKKQIDRALNQKRTEGIFSLLQQNMDTVRFDNDLMIIWYIGKICEKETANGEKTVFEKENNMERLLERCLELKFYLRRIEYNILDEPELFYQFLLEKGISEYELSGIIESCVFCKEKVWKYFR